MLKLAQVKVSLSQEDILFLLMLLDTREEVMSQIKINFFKFEERRLHNKKLSFCRKQIKKLKQAYTTKTVVIYFSREEQNYLIHLLEEVIFSTLTYSLTQEQKLKREQKIQQAKSIRRELEKDTEGTYLIKNLKEKFNVGEKEALIKNEILSQKVINITGLIVGLFLAWLFFWYSGHSLFNPKYSLFDDLLDEVFNLRYDRQNSVVLYAAWGSIILVWFLRNRLGKLFFYVVNIFFKVV